MHWPPCSTDLNIIENLWGVMKRKIYRRPYTVQETLIEVVQELWSSQEIQDFVTVCPPVLLLVLTIEGVIPPISAMTPYRPCSLTFSVKK